MADIFHALDLIQNGSDTYIAKAFEFIFTDNPELMRFILKQAELLAPVGQEEWLNVLQEAAEAVVDLELELK